MNIKRFLKELGTAYYTPDKGIMNCEYGSFVYWHEYRHELQFQNPIVHWLETWLPTFTGFLGLSVWIVAIMWQEVLVLWFAGIFILPISLFLLIIEVDAWIYAIYKKVVNNDKSH